MSEVRYPYGYGRGTMTMAQLRARYGPNMEPEYRARLFAWIEAQGGHIGIGGGRRSAGSQPDKPGFAPEGRSFHQDQRFADGFIGYSAVDLVARNGSGVHRSPTWAEVPAQGSKLAALWGVHCNVSSEAWHMQAIEIDGWASWMNDGQPNPVPGFPFPGRNIGEDEVITEHRRILNTIGGPAIQAGTFMAVHVGTDKRAVMVNVTAINPSADGFLTVWGAGERPTVAALSYDGPQEYKIGNSTLTDVDQLGNIYIYSRAQVHVVVDLQGYWV